MTDTSNGIVLGMVIGTIIGIILTVSILGFTSDTYTQAKEAIELCEQSIPRDQVCEVYARIKDGEE